MSIIELLLTSSILKIGDKECRIVEVEFYQDPDPFIHGVTEQKTSYRWYFHKAKDTGMINSGYKGGTYKGLDLTWGSDEYYGGILIRSIQVDEQIIEGPCKVVDFILCQTGMDNISDLVSLTEYPPSSLDTNFPIHLIVTDPISTPIYSGPRVGLTLNRDSETKRGYIMKPYRFITTPDKISKNKCLMVLSYLKDNNIEDVCNIFNVKPHIVNRWITFYQQGMSLTLIPQFKTVEQLCQTYSQLGQ